MARRFAVPTKSVKLSLPALRFSSTLDAPEAGPWVFGLAALFRSGTGDHGRYVRTWEARGWASTLALVCPMYKLTATYLLPLSNSLRLQREKNDTLEYFLIIDDFSVVIRIINDGHPLVEMPGELAITLASQVEVCVTRDEKEAPLSLPKNSYGGRDLSERSKWIRTRQDDYKKVALRATNRLFIFFKYVQRTPDLQLLREHTEGLLNPTWTDDSGEKVETGIVAIECTFLASSGRQLLGERAFTHADDEALRDALQSDQDVTRAQEFLSNAQTSIVEKNYGRAVLEMAIACEVAIKQAFFKAATPAGAAFEYLERKRKVDLRSIELLHGPALEAFSASFKEIYPTEYQHLDNLFRCRNRVAHRALAQYRDDTGVLHSVDRKNLEIWWQAIEQLFQWLQSATGQPP